MPGILGKIKNKVQVLRKKNFLNLQAIDQIFCSICWNNNNTINKFRVGKTGSDLNVNCIHVFKVEQIIPDILKHYFKY